jgi:hypothetical protein
MLLAAGAIASASADEREHDRWDAAAARETARYGVGAELTAVRQRRTWVDWAIVALATGTFIAFASLARVPQLAIRVDWLYLLVAVSLSLLAVWATTLWRTTRFT